MRLWTRCLLCHKSRLLQQRSVCKGRQQWGPQHLYVQGSCWPVCERIQRNAGATTHTFYRWQTLWQHNWWRQRTKYFCCLQWCASISRLSDQVQINSKTNSEIKLHDCTWNFLQSLCCIFKNHFVGDLYFHIFLIAFHTCATYLEVQIITCTKECGFIKLLNSIVNGMLEFDLFWTV